MIDRKDIQKHLERDIIPFWKNMKDETYGGYIGMKDAALTLHPDMPKGVIYHSRILWFFSNAYELLRDASLLDEAFHAYEFMKRYFIDQEEGGVYWMVTRSGQPLETLKHTYSHAFAIYAFSSFYDVSGETEALDYAEQCSRLLEEKCWDGDGYLESFDRNFRVQANEKLSENGVTADKTMNTMLHVIEAYTEMVRVSRNEAFRKKLKQLLDIVYTKIYNRQLRRQEVFFDRGWNSLIDLHSYGHDIEAAWLLDRGCEVLKDTGYSQKINVMTGEMIAEVYEKAYREGSLLNECENGAEDTNRVWWVQAEAVVGFYHGWQKTGAEKYRRAAAGIWSYIRSNVIDPRDGGEWHAELSAAGEPLDKPVAEPWKGPYHNGRMCLELLRRI